MPDEEMGCGCGCQDCECKEVEICDTTERIDANLRDKLMVFKDYVCTIALTPCSQLGKVMSKVVYYLWCMLKDLVNMIINNRKRTETLMENDEYFCGRMSAISEWTERVNQISISNNQKTLDFVNQFSQLSNSSNEVGHLAKPLMQSMVFKSEPEAVITSVSGGPNINNKTEIDAFYAPAPPNNINVDAVWDGENNGKNNYWLIKNQPLTVTYENLNNSTINGVKVGKLEYIYTLKDIGYKDGSKTVIKLHNDPTVTLDYLDANSTASIKMQANFYDENGNKLSPVGSVLSFSSLNSTTSQDYEAVSDFSGIELVKINGSSVGVVNGVAKATTPNSLKALGSKYDQNEWDFNGSPLEYYGAIAGQVTDDDFSFTISSSKRERVWFAFNTNVKAPVIIKPTLESLPVLPYECNIKEFEC